MLTLVGFVDFRFCHFKSEDADIPLATLHPALRQLSRFVCRSEHEYKCRDYQEGQQVPRGDHA